MKTKTCTKCGQELSISNFRKKWKKDGRIDICKDCAKELIKDGFRICNVCNEIHPYTEQYFNKNKKSKYGLDCICKSCTKSRVKDWQDNNKEKTCEKVSKYSQTEKGKNVNNTKAQRYRSRKVHLLSTLTTKQWKQIKMKFNNKCAYCGQDLPLEQEHFIPLSKGGEYTTYNIIPACRSCNASKHDKDFFEWYPKQDFYSEDREQYILEHLGYDEDNKLEVI